VQQLPWDLLRRGLMALAPSPEAFLALRAQYARSLASVSITGWILGIGDRHLDNLLLSSSDGRVVAIDFGHAFGSATQWLQVPEFMPFRLTRQLVGVLRPLGTEALLQPAMVSALGALHARRELLLRALDVFVRDPISDWETNRATLLTKEAQEALDQIAVEFNADEDDAVMALDRTERDNVDGSHKIARARMQIARRKLDRANPAATLISDLELSKQAGADYVPLLERVARGNALRARVGDQCATIEEQVKCLIELSTSTEALALTWPGWAPFC
jgi:DNA-dependent protein kinase catalytic subunit